MSSETGDLVLREVSKREAFSDLRWCGGPLVLFGCTGRPTCTRCLLLRIPFFVVPAIESNATQSLMAVCGVTRVRRVSTCTAVTAYSSSSMYTSKCTRSSSSPTLLLVLLWSQLNTNMSDVSETPLPASRHYFKLRVVLLLFLCPYASKMPASTAPQATSISNNRGTARHTPIGRERGLDARERASSPPLPRDAAAPLRAKRPKTRKQPRSQSHTPFVAEDPRKEKETPMDDIRAGIGKTSTIIAAVSIIGSLTQLISSSPTPGAGGVPRPDRHCCTARKPVPQQQCAVQAIRVPGTRLYNMDRLMDGREVSEGSCI